ncbi:glycerate kinase [Gloeocapsa sp. PCC 73106]|uniref:glycerate kinase type-2 family protein n=1 Tax=Gloeocapsa sp. PCC 73106 TaxID=102232 RepID=UPI0002AC2E3F|nr:glycerate kinase [Gloeocapsa sp. PCC 73106]ELR96662.1 putative glycerate kinase [Gloeocapsa sp. PCC 73106]
MEQLLKLLFGAAVEAALPQKLMQGFLPGLPRGRTIAVGGGKSAALMAQTFEEHWQGDVTGLVITRYGHRVPTQKIRVVEASHPLPDEQGVASTREIFNLISDLSAEDLVICLLSGGGSALLTLPPAVLTLKDLIEVNTQLLRSGATIREINVVRKHLSLSSGGRLAAAAYPAFVHSLIISDVPGDDLCAIASGPTVGDSITFLDALKIIERYKIVLSSRVRDYLEQNLNPVISSTDPRLENTVNHLIATPQLSLEAAARLAQSYGYQTLILGDSLQGEAREVGIVHAGIVQQIVRHHQPVAPPCVVFSGGETSVTLGKTGKGGRNTEFLLSLAIALEGLAGVYAIACDTDGIDGSENNAGAWITPHTLQRAQDLGLDSRAYLDEHDSYSFFALLESLVITGPTLTNVNDFRAVLVTQG